MKELTDFSEIIGESKASKELQRLIEQAAPMDLPVLLYGESGTGKSIAAREIHFRSQRKAKSFVSINISSVPGDLLEVFLCGRVRGAYAIYQAGSFENANTGTLLINGIDHLPIHAQFILLRMMEQQVISRLGDPAEIHVDVRVIAATDSDLEKEVAAGRFRRELFQKLSSLTIAIPPLRSRKEDIPLLTKRILEGNSRYLGKQIRSIAPEAMQRLKAYPWPGNIRELESVIVSAAIHSRSDTISCEDLEVL